MKMEMIIKSRSTRATTGKVSIIRRIGVVLNHLIFSHPATVPDVIVTQMIERFLSLPGALLLWIWTMFELYCRPSNTFPSWAVAAIFFCNGGKELPFRMWPQNERPAFSPEGVVYDRL